MAQLLRGLPGQDDVVYEDQDAALLLPQILLLPQQLREERGIPLREEEPGIEALLHNLVDDGVARRAPDKGHDQVELMSHPEDKVAHGGRLSLLPAADQR